MLEKGKRAVLHVFRAGPDLNVVPLNDVSVFMFEHGVDAEVVKEFIERTSQAVAETEEKLRQQAADEKARDEEWERKRSEKKTRTLKS